MLNFCTDVSTGENRAINRSIVSKIVGCVLVYQASKRYLPKQALIGIPK